MSKPESLFAQALGDLMKVTAASQKDWSETLGVTESTVWQWLNDVALPPPQKIKALANLVRGLDGSEGAIEQFYRIAEKPANAVTPLHRQIRRSINFYLSEHSFRQFEDRILSIVRNKTLRENEEIWKKFASFLDALPKQ